MAGVPFAAAALAALVVSGAAPIRRTVEWPGRHDSEEALHAKRS